MPLDRWAQGHDSFVDLTDSFDKFQCCGSWFFCIDQTIRHTNLRMIIFILSVHYVTFYMETAGSVFDENKLGQIMR